MGWDVIERKEVDPDEVKKEPAVKEKVRVRVPCVWNGAAVAMGHQHHRSRHPNW